MKNTLYEILEVSENASKEIIEKAYKVLAKKYHPDLQISEDKQTAEKKMKQINEAYDVLSDDIKRKQYDEQLKNQREVESRSKIHYQSNEEEQYYYNREVNDTQAREEQRYRQIQRRKYEEELLKRQRQMEQDMQKQYQNAYYDYLRSLGYRIKERWTWEKTKKLMIAILIMIGILVILWFLPPTHKIMLNLYEENSIVKVIVDIIFGVVGAFFKAIDSAFKSLFNGW